MRLVLHIGGEKPAPQVFNMEQLPKIAVGRARLFSFKDSKPRIIMTASYLRSSNHSMIFCQTRAKPKTGQSGIFQRKRNKSTKNLRHSATTQSSKHFWCRRAYQTIEKYRRNSEPLSLDFSLLVRSILFFMREQVSLLISSYSTYVLHGGTKSMIEYSSEYFSAESRYFNHEKMLADWSDLWRRKHHRKTICA